MKETCHLMSNRILKPSENTYINFRLEVCPTIDLQCPDESTARTDKGTLNKYFTSVFIQENPSTIPSFTLGASAPLL